MNNKQTMFLPDYLMKGFDSALLRRHSLVSETNLLLPSGQKDNTSFFTPVFLFSMVLVVMIVLSFLRTKTAAGILTALDSLFFLLTGLLGLLMLVLWIARVDNVCRNNYNLLWALPTHTVIAFVINRQKKWIRYYWLLTALINALMLTIWKWLPQEMNNSILLVVAILLFRSIVHFRKTNRS